VGDGVGVLVGVSVGMGVDEGVGVDVGVEKMLTTEHAMMAIIKTDIGINESKFIFSLFILHFLRE